jgi:hypothetical protein
VRGDRVVVVGRARAGLPCQASDRVESQARQKEQFLT